jgi:hypothetical protein
MALTQIFAANERPSATKLNEKSIPVVSAVGDVSAPYVGQIVFSTSDSRLWRCTATTPTWVVFTGGPVWALSRTTAQSIPNSAWTTLNFTEDDVDSDNMHAANADTVVITKAGLYALAAKGSNVGNATGQRGCRLTLNGSADGNTIKGTSVIVNNVGASFTAAIPLPSVYKQLAVNDTLRVQQWQNSGGALNTSVASLGDQTLFTGTWLRD